jgi:hypothetical protein
MIQGANYLHPADFLQPGGEQFAKIDTGGYNSAAEHRNSSLLISLSAGWGLNNGGMVLLSAAPIT